MVFLLIHQTVSVLQMLVFKDSSMGVRLWHWKLWSGCNRPTLLMAQCHDQHNSWPALTNRLSRFSI